MGLYLNKIMIAGNLTKAPEIKYTSSGKAVANLSLAVNEPKSDAVSFFRVIVWEKQAENAVKYLDKGSPVIIEGKIQSRKYDKDGETRSAFEIVAHNVQYLYSGKKESDPYADVPPPEDPRRDKRADEISGESKHFDENNVVDGEYKDSEDGDIPF